MHPILQIFLASVARNELNSVPKVSATTFTFSSVIILLLCWGVSEKGVWGSEGLGESPPGTATLEAEWEGGGREVGGWMRERIPQN